MSFFSKKSSSSGSSATSASTKTTKPVRGANQVNPHLGPREFMRQKQLERTAELSALEPGALYILLFYRSKKDNDFHWGLYHHISSAQGGWKYHIQGSEGRWWPDHGMGTTTGALASAGLVGLVSLTNLGVDKNVAATVRRIITAEDEQLNQISGLTCRIFVSRACERLKEGHYLDFSDWAHLQQEVFDLGNRALSDFEGEKAPKPRPILKSRIAR